MLCICMHEPRFCGDDSAIRFIVDVEETNQVFLQLLIGQLAAEVLSVYTCRMAMPSRRALLVAGGITMVLLLVKLVMDQLNTPSSDSSTSSTVCVCVCVCACVCVFWL